MMKLTVFFLMVMALQVSARGYTQSVTLSVKNTPLKEVFEQLKAQTGLSFLWDESTLKDTRPVTISLANVPVRQVLDECVKNQPISYSIIQNMVVIKIKPAAVKDIIRSPEQPAAIDIKGIVRNENDEPLSGASVIVKGTSNGTSTDKNGQFMLRNVDGSATLVISFIGYFSKEVPVNGGRSFSIHLKQKPDPLSEPIVIGYGTTTKRTSTASISSITAEEIGKQPVSNPLNALQGRIAGALVTQSNGLPGSRVTIQIRGINSIDPTGAGTQPLYIVDGVPFNIYDNSVPATNDLNGRGSFAASGGLSPFNLINPNDIERIDILKDADATAIYGTRGANGVVLITTKRGKAGKTKLNVNFYQGGGKVGHFIPLMNTEQYLTMRKEAYANDGLTPNAANAPDLLLWDQNANTDWQQKYLGGTGNITDAQTTVSGGDQRTRFLLSAGYHRETPVFPGDFKDERISTRLSVDHNSADRKFNANVSVNYSFDNTNLLSRDLSTLYSLPPNLPLYNSDGSLYWNANFTNPESYLLVKYFGKTNNMMANTLLRYTILPGLDIKTSFGFNRVSLDQNTQNPALSKNPLSSVPTNSASFAYIDQKSYIFEPQITYTKKIDDGKLSALVGSTFQNVLNTSLRLSGNNYSTPVLLGSISGAGTESTPSYGYTQYRYNSIFGRITYDWKKKYLLNAVYRRDGSSRFGPGNKFANFWDIGAGWIFSEEGFAKDLNFLSFGKLRASYGSTGNDQIQDYLYQAAFTSSGTYQNNAALAPNQVENSDLHWQTTYKLEFGLDMAFFKERVQLTANYYRNRTPDQLSYLSLSSQTGFNSVSSNFDAHIQNTGLEFELNTKNINNKDFRWSTSFNITIPQTKLLSASPSYFYYNKSILGKPLSVRYGYIYEGVDPTTGKPLYKDIGKDSLTFTPDYGADRAVIGYSAPKFYGGLNNVFDYKNFEFSFFFQFTKQEGNIYPSPPSGDFTAGVLSNGNLPVFLLDSWMKPGDNAKFPGYTTSPYSYYSLSSSTATWGDASFIRLRTVNISYSFSEAVLKRLRLESLKIFLQGQNLWWASKNKYVYDPETGSAMPPLRVITAGINVTL